MAVIATLSGTGLRPGVSKNRRYYSPELIGQAVQRAQARLADPDGRPITMRVAHPRPDEQAYVPVTEIVGRVTGMTQAADGSMRFTADLFDTRAGQDVLSLTDTRGKYGPALKNVSIRGRWLGDTVTTMVDGVQCEAADDLEIDGLDFTHLPGVDGAQVDQVAAPGAALETAGADALIYESCEETHVTETATTEAAPVPYADLGYLADGKQRWPLGTLSEARAAWNALAESVNADKYTSKQLKRVRERTVRALRGFGVEVRRDVLAESATPVLVQRGPLTEAFFDGEYVRPGEFYVRLDNGAVCITVSSCSIDPHDLGRIGTAAMGGAVQALLAMDPDDDGDIDVPGAPYQDTGEAAPKPAGAPADDDGDVDDEDDTEAEESAPVQPVTTETPASTEDAVTTESEAPVMTDATQAAAAEATPATEAPAAAPLTLEALTAFGTAMGEALAAKLAPAAPVAVAPVETPAVEAAPAAAPAVQETEDQRIQRLVNEALQQRVAAGDITPTRKGLVGRVNESGALEPVGTNVEEGLNEHGLPRAWAGDKAAHELKGQQRSHLSATLMQHVVGHRI